MATFTLHKDKLVECPFDKNHKIATRNQIKHIIECEKKIVSKFSVCIYNASHRMARNEFAQHINNCPDGRQYIRDAYISRQTNSASIEPEVSTKHSIESQVTSNSQTPLQKLDEEDSDNWDNDNCPQYSIYGINEDISKSNENKTQKLTKNQKKRNRRKASIASKESQSIWD